MPRAILPGSKEDQSMSRSQIFLVALVVIVAGIGGSLLARQTLDRPGPTQAEMTAGTLIQPPRSIPAVSLVDQDEKSFDNSRLRGRWTLVFFGFTNCPDICPTTLAMLKQIDAQLAAVPPQQHPQVILVSVDPQRDTPSQLKTYLATFNPAFLGVTGSTEQIDAITKAFSVPYAVYVSAEGAHRVDHSGAIFLVNPDGAMYALFSTPHDPEKIAADLRRIVAS